MPQSVSGLPATIPNRSESGLVTAEIPKPTRVESAKAHFEDAWEDVKDAGNHAI